MLSSTATKLVLDPGTSVKLKKKKKVILIKEENGIGVRIKEQKQGQIKYKLIKNDLKKLERLVLNREVDRD